MSRTRDDVVLEMLEALPARFDRSVGSVPYDLQMPTAIEVSQLEETNETILDNAFFETADDEHKEIIAKDRANIERKQATYASGNVTITGVQGTVIPIGTKVASDYLVFDTVQEATVDANGEAVVKVQCETAGVTGNIGAGEIYEFPVTIADLNTVTNEEAFTNGYDIEDMDDFSDRYYAAIRTSGYGGSVDDYMAMCSQVEGVGQAKVFARTPSVGYVTIYITDRNHSAASAELIQQTKDYIDENRPCPAGVYVYSATEKQVDVVVTLATVDDDSSAYADAVEDAINEYLEDIGFKDNNRKVSYALLGDSILDVEGVVDYSGLTINGGVANVELDDIEIPVLGTLTVL